jgi:hypothetical protein
MNQEDVRSRADLVLFLDALAERSEATSGDWENNTVPRYICGAARWVAAMDGWYLNAERPMPDQPTWEMIARIFRAAAEYE